MKNKYATLTILPLIGTLAFASGAKAQTEEMKGNTDSAQKNTQIDDCKAFGRQTLRDLFAKGTGNPDEANKIDLTGHDEACEKAPERVRHDTEGFRQAVGLDVSSKP